ncbi:abnormal spindle-like microcephaly-associated protein homolog [Ctenocephalides felis]|uniref:abnormal spindle-like microcephaly-associated protein homolog n=1 Tax=Ctenocephalides felis TaxID=7515 RepID=UPI000E6E375C|nr:abnormal spindle-like microcephaly-associated protein homolog [Ctenocephalides felis]
MTLSANSNATNRLGSQQGRSLQLAAVRIQAGYRGYRVRKQLKRLSKSKVNGCKENSMAESSLNRDNVDIVEKSATKIQAGVRGFLVRRKHNKEKEAATKIQAGFRGFKVRKEFKKANEV